MTNVDYYKKLYERTFSLNEADFKLSALNKKLGKFRMDLDKKLDKLPEDEDGMPKEKDVNKLLAKAERDLQKYKGKTFDDDYDPRYPGEIVKIDDIEIVYDEYSNEFTIVINDEYEMG